MIRVLRELWRELGIAYRLNQDVQPVGGVSSTIRYVTSSSSVAPKPVESLTGLPAPAVLDVPIVTTAVSIVSPTAYWPA